MEKCKHGTEGCKFGDKEHDEDCCYTGYHTHRYVCQACGYIMDSTAPNSLESPAEFPARNCPRCKSEKSVV